MKFKYFLPVYVFNLIYYFLIFIFRFHVMHLSLFNEKFSLLLKTPHFHFKYGSEWARIGEYFSVGTFAHMAVKIDGSSLMAFINSIRIWHFYLKTILHRKLFNFSN